MNRFRRIDFASLYSWRPSTTNKVAVSSRQVGNRFLGSLKGLQIRTQFSLLYKKIVILGWMSVGGMHDVTLDHTIYVMTGIERPIIYWTDQKALETDHPFRAGKFIRENRERWNREERERSRRLEKENRNRERQGGRKRDYWVIVQHSAYRGRQIRRMSSPVK